MVCTIIPCLTSNPSAVIISSHYPYIMDFLCGDFDPFELERSVMRDNETTSVNLQTSDYLPGVARSHHP